MASLIFENQVINREVPFCRVYSMDSKQKLEKLFLKNRISYFIQWEGKSFFSRVFGGSDQKEKNTFTIRINEADVERATELIQGMDSVKLKKI